jgi:hypothetical protein
MNIIEKVVHEQADENLLLQSGTFILLVIEKIFGMNVNLQLYINLLRKIQNIKSPSILQVPSLLRCIFIITIRIIF